MGDGDDKGRTPAAPMSQIAKEVCNMSGGGPSPGPGPGPGRTNECGDFDIELSDWQLQYPGNQHVPSMPDPSPVHLQPDPNDNTIQVYDLGGTKLGHINSLRLRQCLAAHDYTALLIKRNGVPYVKATRTS